MGLEYRLPKIRRKRLPGKYSGETHEQSAVLFLLLFLIGFPLIVTSTTHRENPVSVQPTRNYTKTIDIWIHTKYYDAGLSWGFIHQLSIEDYPDLLNYSSWIGTSGEHYGLGLNEIHYQGPQWYWAEPTTYTSLMIDGRLRIQAITSDHNFYSFNNTWFFNNNSETIEVYTTRILRNYSSSSHQVCFIVPVQSVQAFFDNKGKIPTTSDSIYIESYSPYAGYILKSGLKMQITILDSNPTTQSQNCSFDDSSLGGHRVDYNEIQVTFWKSGDSGPNVSFQNSTIIEYVHYLLSFSKG